MGNWSSKRGEGKAVAFLRAQMLRAQVSHVGDDCVIWPFSKMPTGYGAFGYLGKQHYAHRFMCELANGIAPEGKPYATHSCHNPSCVNPRHLSWGSASDNMQDKKANGTSHLNGGQGRKGKLSPEQVAEVRAQKGQTTVAVLAAIYRVTEKTICNVQGGKTYSGKPTDWQAAARKRAETIRKKVPDVTF